MTVPMGLHARVASIVDRRAEETARDMIGWRHHLHQNPELSNREANTAAFVVKQLAACGVDEVRQGVAGHGVVAILRGAAPGGRTIVLRADMDALPVPDQSGVDFASEAIAQTHDGGSVAVSHACGHDCHTAMLLGAMRILAEQREHLPGTVVAVFQPAEEGPPVDETGGARAMLDAGALDGLEPTMAFGMHVQPFPKATVALRSGHQFAASCMVRIVIRGAQVHGSTPWAGVDPMPAVGAILQGIGQIYRQTDAFAPFTVTIGHIEDVGRFNVIGDSVTLWGTIRSLDDSVMAHVRDKVERLAQGSAAAAGCSCQVDFLQPVPAVNNTPDWVRAVRPSLEAVVGAERVITPNPTLGYDDVSEFVARCGGVYVGLGVQDTRMRDGIIEPIENGRGVVPNHHPAFYADDETLVVGVKLHARVAIDHLFGE